jgi:hypothetical protein
MPWYRMIPLDILLLLGLWTRSRLKRDEHYVKKG